MTLNPQIKDALSASQLLERLTVMRSLLGTPPIMRLIEMIDAIEDGDTEYAASCYHALTGTLLNTNTRRVTGDVWKDFIFSQLIEIPNRYSELAAKHKKDPPVISAMQGDLAILQQLFSIEDETLFGWMNSSPQLQLAEPPREPDKISKMASSAWSGGASRSRRPVPVESPQERPKSPDFASWTRWSYDEPGAPVEYSADDGLAVLYRQFLASEDWPELESSLYEFHEQYGCGSFLRYRVFAASDGGLYECEQIEIPDWDSLIDFGSQKERLYANTLRFSHTGKADDVLLYGADGMGKTSLVLSLVRELDVYLVFLNASNYDAAMSSIRLLQSQPHRFILFMDDLALREIDCRRLKIALSTSQPNILIYAASVVPPLDNSVFGLQLSFEMPDYNDFCETVRAIIQREHARVPYDAIEDACSQYQLENDDFSVRAARRTAMGLIRTHANTQ